MKCYANYLQQNMTRNASELQTITTKFDTPSVSMAEAISERFGEPRIAVLRNVIEQGIKDLFLSFDEKTRKELASVADEKTTAYMLSKGAEITTIHAVGKFDNEWSDWRQVEFDNSIHGLALSIRASNPDMSEDEAFLLAQENTDKEQSC